MSKIGFCSNLAYPSINSFCIPNYSVMYVLACILICLLLFLVCTELLIAIVVSAFCYPGPTHMELGEVILVISDFFFKSHPECDVLFKIRRCFTNYSCIKGYMVFECMGLLHK